MVQAYEVCILIIDLHAVVIFASSPTKCLCVNLYIDLCITSVLFGVPNNISIPRTVIRIRPKFLLVVNDPTYIYILNCG